MVREEPYFRKCCFCVPLRPCLQIWSCIKVLTDLALAGFFLLLLLLLKSYHELERDQFTLAHAFLIIIPMLIIDSILMLVHISGLCAKNLRILKVIYYYSIFMVFYEAVIIIWFLVFFAIEEVTNNEFYSITASSLLINLVLDFTFIFTLKSEIIKLRNKQLFEFVRISNVTKKDDEMAVPSSVPGEEGLEPFQADEETVA